MLLTPAQEKAVAAEGDVVVIAGAGTGKTSTLVERCMSRLLSGDCSLDQILMVTFTEAAAAEMRQRIRQRLEEETEKDPSRFAKQLALLETAFISTLHGFCFQLVVQHFYELGIDPQVSVLDEDEAKLLAGEILEEQFRKHLEADSELSRAVQDLVQHYGAGRDWPIRQLVLRLYKYSQTLPDPESWLSRQKGFFECADAAGWRPWLLKAANIWRAEWLPTLSATSPENEGAHCCARALGQIEAIEQTETLSALLKTVLQIRADWPKGTKGAFRKPIEGFFDDAEFLFSLIEPLGSAAQDPLTEDWEWVRGHISTLLGLVTEFASAYNQAKREMAAADFQDLEQFALRLLWDPKKQQATDLARQWQNRLHFLLVDEYQDINQAQHTILGALMRTRDASNRFVVGDIKQSIYRFRLADPRIFQEHARLSDRTAQNRTLLWLCDNFRSREKILDFVNSFFGALMRHEFGGVSYGEEAKLRFAETEDRQRLGRARDNSICVELHIRLKGKSSTPEESLDEESDPGEESERQGLAELKESEKEARLVALRLRELERSGLEIWDSQLNTPRKVCWKDIVILLRAPANKRESYAKEFSRLKVPLQVCRRGFYESPEISDLLSILHLLDNPLQDIPLLAVLRSPLVGLSVDELATIRLTVRKGYFWKALQQFHSAERNVAGWERVNEFLRRYTSWRQLARQFSLGECLEQILRETHYQEWLSGQPGGEQAIANIARLLESVRQFDRFQRRGLQRFLRLVKAQREADIDPDPANVQTEDAVRLMSIHQSKGLEFPVVVLADLAKAFNLADIRQQIILDEEYGICPQVKPPHTRQSYPSLAHWLASKRQKQEILSEELRLLYVALTRARDRILLVGSATEKNLRSAQPTDGVHLRHLAGARSYLDWVRLWLSSVQGNAAWSERREGSTDLISWRLHEEADFAQLEHLPSNMVDPLGESAEKQHDPIQLDQLVSRLTWLYPFSADTSEPAKTSVSILRRRTAGQPDSEARLAPYAMQPRWPRIDRRAPGLSASEIGEAHHRFLQYVDLGRIGEDSLRDEVKRLLQLEILSDDQAAVLDLPGFAAFWQSEVGRRIAEERYYAHRELPFTARFSSEDLVAATLRGTNMLSTGEFVLVQGVVDLAVILPDEIWLLDLKTDRADEGELDAKGKLYGPQIQLYALAIARIYQRPVSRKWLHFLSARTTVSLD